MGSTKMFAVLVLVYVLGITSARNTRRFDLEDALTDFEEFIVKYNKIYTESEKQIRYEIFLENLERINIMNEMSEFAEFGINKFADLTSEEFVSMYTGYRPSDTPDKCIKRSSSEYKQAIPDEFDWRSRNVVSRVKQQGACGSCWAFSVIGNIESINAIKTGKMVELSEQQLVDCDHDDLFPGCAGSYPDKTYLKVMKDGVMSEASYPYIAKNVTCKYDAQKVAVRISDCISLDGDEDAVAKFLYEVGPLSIAIDATHLQTTVGGIHDNCPTASRPNHAVLLVGYGKDPFPHWIVKNSWGENWGDGGYFKLKKGVNCLLLLDAPILSAVIN